MLKTLAINNIRKSLCLMACFIALSYHRQPYALKQKPKTCDYFKNTHTRIEPPQVNCFGEVGENDENESTRRAPCRRDHTKGSQCPGDIARIKQQADVIHIEIRTHVELRQGLQSLRFKYM